MSPIDAKDDSALIDAEEKAVAGLESEIGEVSIDAGDDNGGVVQGGKWTIRETDGKG